MQIVDLLKVNRNVEIKLLELEELVDNHPLRIPIEIACKFTGMGKDELRACIANGACPFALCWKKDGKQNRAFFIPTTPFYLWYKQVILCQMNMNMFKEGAV